MSTIIPSWQIPTRRARLIRTRKYVAVICMERWGGSYFSRSGWSTFIPRKQVTTEWIGANLKKALYSSEDFGARLPRPIPDESFDSMEPESGAQFNEFWLRIQQEFGFKDLLSAMSKSAMVFVDWPEDKDDEVEMLSSRGSGAHHSAWGTNENFGKVFHASINLNDLEFGEVAVQALDRCQPNHA
ncbi:hypothetical protein [Asaia bogorensis]|uniref:Uncharacterized protein n=1 Tax=Asaia bogorensis NBRC 16594 TaxID=1231624 RepID=A0AAN4U2E3_9PROT|nr:hypothetical protein [Asaia bogorensis]BAT19100.1 hypothetical protein Asbog_00805 [Asaia bogorensis NBRC 16594]GBQ73197.1 hypothetical protein AA0311_0139 [Asaia bogorensis NBRC 16594]GEL53456.1 hypothetical protein ABO01nite_14630 [Asaia bogorensis NBRC 16594]